MANKLVLGTSGFDKLMLGYERNVSQIETRTFKVDETEVDGILPGSLLVVTGTTQVYKTPTQTTDVIAGVCLATNVKTDRWFPQSDTDVVFQPGDRAAALIHGDIAVKLYGTAPKEGDKVYYDLTNKAFTTNNSGTLAFPGARFTGETEGDVTVIYVQYI